MNPLESFIQTNQLDETGVMNALQSFGVISDNCVTARDVSNGDCDRAVRWLNPQEELL